jgi:hypothetical protein
MRRAIDSALSLRSVLASFMIAFAMSAESKIDTTSSGITSMRRFASHSSMCCVSMGYCFSFWRFIIFKKNASTLFHTAEMRLFFLMLMIVACDGDAFDDALVSELPSRGSVAIN